MIQTDKPSIESLQIQLQERDQKIAYLEEQIAWLKRQIFGKKSERIVEAPPEQLKFDGFASTSEQKVETQQVSSHQRKIRTSIRG
jgi:hypothetical protein